VTKPLREPNPAASHKAKELSATRRLRSGPIGPSVMIVVRRIVNVKKRAKASARHLHPECFVLVTLDRFRGEEQKSRWKHHGDAANQPRLGTARLAHEWGVAQPHPRRLRSTTSTAPPRSASPSKWTASIAGRSHCELRIALPSADCSIDAKTDSSVISYESNQL
jgi:hypothetical protein